MVIQDGNENSQDFVYVSFLDFLVPVYESIYIEYCNLIVSYFDILPLSDLARPILSHLPLFFETLVIPTTLTSNSMWACNTMSSPARKSRANDVLSYGNTARNTGFL